MHNNLEIIAQGTIELAAPHTPTWRLQRGFLAAITDTGAGDCTVHLAGGGADATECCVLVMPASPMIASSQISFGVVHTSDTAKQITCVQEAVGGAASVRTDNVFSVVVVRRKAV
jgi:hypothetical protein